MPLPTRSRCADPTDNITQPHFDPVEHEPKACALMAHRRRLNSVPQPHATVWAIADTGASHVLIRESDAWILSDVSRRTEQDPPYAAMNAANGGILAAFGRGQITIGGLALVAYIFRDDDLTSNLLGLAPFADRGCESVFKEKSFQIY